VLAGDLRDDDVQLRTVRQHRVDERRREIDAPAGRPQHPLDELGHLAGGEDQRGELRAAPARDEHAAGLVDPDLLDRPVVEERLQRTEPGDRVEHGTRHVCRIAERRQRRRHRAIEVLTDHIVDQPAHHVRFGDRIDATPADEFANLALDDRRCRAHPVGPIHAKKSQRAYLSSLTGRYHLTTRCGYLRRAARQQDDGAVQVRRAVTADAPRIADLHVRGWQAGYRGLLPQSLLDALDPAQRVPRWTATVEEAAWPASGTLVAGGRRRPARITSFYVAPDA